MCYNCDPPGHGTCFCTGGSVFALCPCQKGHHCSVCGHNPKYNEKASGGDTPGPGWSPRPDLLSGS